MTLRAQFSSWLAARPGRPGCDGPLVSLTVQDEVDPLGEERDQATDVQRVMQWVL